MLIKTILDTQERHGDSSARRCTRSRRRPGAGQTTEPRCQHRPASHCSPSKELPRLHRHGHPDAAGDAEPGDQNETRTVKYNPQPIVPRRLIR
ncbi:hypothetical protein HBB16_01125 [Pseudonocardia sp. MCCB 268]|nr:hypothetical protein [Pseudonocardia cytotoxica]